MSLIAPDSAHPGWVLIRYTNGATEDFATKTKSVPLRLVGRRLVASRPPHFSAAMSAQHDLIRKIYAAFNARDISAILATFAPQVRWSRAWEGD